MLDIKHLRLIEAIDEYGSLNKASKKLHLTQSALSHQLKNLEESLGLELFHRMGNQLLFTAAGRALQEQAQTILEQVSSLEDKLQSIKEDQQQRYIHGYSQKEAQRLLDQANSVEDYLHYDSIWEPNSQILEVGCGVGAQTVIIAPKNKDSQFVSIDISAESLAIAAQNLQQLEIDNVSLQHKNVNDLNPKEDGLFDHIFICFVLEHLSNPKEILNKVKTVLKPRGTITLIEGDHGSTFFHPQNTDAQKLVQAQVNLQEKRGGNANIGRQLYPLLQATGFRQIEVSPRQIYVDYSKGLLVDGFIKNTFTAMIQGMAEDLIQEELVSHSVYETGVKGLLRTAQKDGVFSYTFFKGKAVNN